VPGSKCEVSPEKAAMVHGKIEHRVQLMLTAVPCVIRFWEYVEGHTALENTSFNTTSIRGKLALVRWGFNAMKRHDRKYFTADEVPPISNALYALSKLFSGAGDHKRYFLNKSDMLKGACNGTLLR
jgi:hypothetical protein